MRRLLPLLLLAMSALTAVAQQIDPNIVAASYPPIQSSSTLLGVIPPIRDLPRATMPSVEPTGKTWQKKNYFKTNPYTNPNPLPQHGDPLAVPQTDDTPEQTGQPLIPILNFEGLDDPNVTPPDPSGDIGKNHYVQMINTSGGAWFQIWDKAGNVVLPPTLTSTIWDQVNSGSIGDPIIQYDHAAERWLMMEMQGFGENQILVAISDTDDPTGAWKAYRVQCIGFPDYPKLYVWNNAYFITVNEIVASNVCSGYALNRDAMLSGAANVPTWRFEFPNYNAIQYQPATGVDWEMGPPPPPGAPGMILRVYDDGWDGGSDRIEMWEINLDWQNISSSFSNGPIAFNVAPFETRVCYGGGLFDCLEQPDVDPTVRITALENIIMYRAPYQNFGTHESIVFNHVADVSGQVGDGGDAAVRWYELRRNSGESDWSVYQQGTYAPDLATNRFMGTISMDARGNIALGYSVVSTEVYPGLRITGRRNGDPLGQMTIDEYTLMPGSKPYNGARWGDYSSMAVDPYDGQTFWFTGEYMPNINNDTWATRVGSFQIRRDTYDIQPVVITTPVNSALLGAAEPVTVEIANVGILPASDFNLRLSVDGVLLGIEHFNDTIQPATSAFHTFGPTVGWTNILQSRQIEVITEWDDDRFRRNDTIRTTVKKLTSFDAAITGTSTIPGLICTEDFTFGLFVQNASGLPMDSVRIRWRLGAEPWQIINWTGHLLPGESDTIDIQLTDLVNGQYAFVAQTLLPNGQPDQFTFNDRIQFDIRYNDSGAFMTIRSNTDIGSVRYTIETQSGFSIATGVITPGEQLNQFCATDGTCYKLILEPISSSWFGNLQLLDIYNDLVHEEFFLQEDVEVSFCAPIRRPNDVGAVALVTPVAQGQFTNNESVTVAVRNFGLLEAANIQVAWRTAGGVWNEETMTTPIAPGVTASYQFQNSTLDASALGETYTLELKATILIDEDLTNDQTTANVQHRAQLDLSIDSIIIRNCDNLIEYVQFPIFTNRGLSRVDSFQMEYKINNITDTLRVYDIGLPPDGSYTGSMILTPDMLNQSNNALQLSIIQVNGTAPDQYQRNDTLSTDFVLYADGMSVNLLFQADGNPQETTWQILDDTGQVIASGGPSDEPFQFSFKELCLERDSCFTIRLLDTGNNGYDGYIQINEGLTGRILYEYFSNQTPFTNEYTAPFCATSVCAFFDFNYTVYPVTSPNLTNGKILIQTNGGTSPYEYRLNNGTWQDFFLFTNLAVGDYVAESRDVFGCTESKTVTVTLLSSTETQEENYAIRVNPNPTTGLAWVTCTAPADIQAATAHLYTQRGEYLREVQLTRFDDQLRGAFSLEKSPDGVYLLQVRDAKGRILATERVVKAH
jgi:hypothetical protein